MILIFNKDRKLDHQKGIFKYKISNKNNLKPDLYYFP
jgi:hypothetical protein